MTWSFSSRGVVTEDWPQCRLGEVEVGGSLLADGLLEARLKRRWRKWTMGRKMRTEK